MRTSWVYDDGGREAAGFKGRTRDCVTRSIAIATGLPYKAVYDALYDRSVEFGATRRSAAARVARRNPTPRTGVFREVYEPFLFDHGWVWEPLMSIGSGTTVHLRADELPDGVVVASCSRHLTTVIDGRIHDTHDPSRDGTRAVYGIYTPGAEAVVR